MPNLSHIMVAGHLGRDAEPKQVGERTVINFSIATSRKVKDTETTTWWRVAYWVKADRVSKLLTKGTPVLVIGEAYSREYDGEGGKRVSLEIDAKEVKLLGGKQDKEAAPAAAPSRPARPAVVEDQDSAPF